MTASSSGFLRRPCSALVVPALALGIAVTGAPDLAAAKPLRVATWNIEWLDATPNTGQIPRDSSDYEMLSAIADELDADVVALQEVEGPEAAALVFDPGEYLFFFSDREDAQRTGFAVRREIAVLADDDFRDLSLGDRVRRGTDISIEVEGKPLRLLSVHLKSFCFEGPLDRGRDCRTFGQQVPILEAWIDARTAEGGAFVLLGDFNRRFDVSGDVVWPELDDGQPAGLDLVLANEGEISGCEGGRYPAYIDHIVLDEEAAEWLVPDSFGQIVSPLEDVERFKLSDHCPIFVDLDIPGEGDVADPTERAERLFREIRELVGETEVKMQELEDLVPLLRQ